MGNRKTWAIILGTTAGVTMVSLVVTWYLKTHRDGEPMDKDAQTMISEAYEKIRDLEQSLEKWHSTEDVG